MNQEMPEESPKFEKPKFLASETGLWVDSPENRATLAEISAEAGSMDFSGVGKKLEVGRLYANKLAAVRQLEEGMEYNDNPVAEGSYSEADRSALRESYHSEIEKAEADAKNVRDIFGEIHQNRDLNAEQIDFLLRYTKESIRTVDNAAYGMHESTPEHDANKARRKELLAVELFLTRKSILIGNKRERRS